MFRTTLTSRFRLYYNFSQVKLIFEVILVNFKELNEDRNFVLLSDYKALFIDLIAANAIPKIYLYQDITISPSP